MKINLKCSGSARVKLFKFYGSSQFTGDSKFKNINLSIRIFKDEWKIRCMATVVLSCKVFRKLTVINEWYRLVF